MNCGIIFSAVRNIVLNCTIFHYVQMPFINMHVGPTTRLVFGEEFWKLTQKYHHLKVEVGILKQQLAKRN